MPDEHQLASRQIDQARGDLYAISEELAVLQAQLVRLPTRTDLTRLVLLATLTGTALVLAGIEVFFR
jgi:hypothetical protein